MVRLESHEGSARSRSLARSDLLPSRDEPLVLRVARPAWRGSPHKGIHQRTHTASVSQTNDLRTPASRLRRLISQRSLQLNGDSSSADQAGAAILRAVDPLVELLDRQVDFLLRQTEPAAFLIQIEPFLSALRTEPQLAAYLDDLVEGVVDIIDAMEEVDAELTSELVELRRELVELRPEADDSSVEPPSASHSPADKLQARLSYQGTLAYFDEWAGSQPEPFDAGGVGGVARTLLGILRNKETAYLYELNAAVARQDAEAEAKAPTGDQPPAAEDRDAPAGDQLDAWRRRLGNVQRRYDYAVRLLRLRTRTSAGLALLKLEAVPDELNPPARVLDEEGEDSLAAASDRMRWASSESYSLFKLAWQERMDGADFDIIDNRVGELRDAVDRLQEDLRRRIGTTRSRLALVNRFKVRCEWHDRDHMVALADDDRLAPDRRVCPLPLRRRTLPADKAVSGRAAAGPPRPSRELLRPGKAIRIVHRSRRHRQERVAGARHGRAPARQPLRRRRSVLCCLSARGSVLRLAPGPTDGELSAAPGAGRPRSIDRSWPEAAKQSRSDSCRRVLHRRAARRGTRVGERPPRAGPRARLTLHLPPHAPHRLRQREGDGEGCCGHCSGVDHGAQTPGGLDSEGREMAGWAPTRLNPCG
jgi:hypothetical protein